MKRLMAGLPAALLLLSACATSPNDQSEAGLSAKQAEGNAAAKRPSVPREVYNDTYFQLMVGELAGQTGNIAESVVAYREAMLRSPDPRIAERAVEIAGFAGVAEVAHEAAERWAQLDAGNIEAHLSHGLWAMRLGKIDTAVTALQRFVEGYEGGKSAGFRDLAKGLRRENLDEATLQVFQQLVAKNPGIAEAEYAAAVVALQAGQAGVALAYSNDALNRKPSLAEAAILKAEAARQLGDIEQAISTLDRAVRARPGDLKLRLIHAQVLLRAERDSEAEAAYKRILGMSPGNPDALYALGLLALDGDRRDAAKHYFEKAWNVNQRADRAAFYLGLIAEEEAQAGNERAWDEALTWFGRVSEGDTLANAQYRVGMILARRGEVADMRSHFAELRQRLPEQAVQFYAGEAEALYELGRYEAAHAVYNEALREHPEDPDLLYGRALAGERLGRIVQVERDLRKILEQRPDDPVVINALGYTLADRTDRHEEALDLIERALELAPDKPFIVDSMGWVLFKLGQHQRALEYLQRAYQALRDPEVAAHLGEVLWTLGDQQRARSILVESSAENPGHTGNVVRDVLKRLSN